MLTLVVTHRRSRLQPRQGTGTSPTQNHQIPNRERAIRNRNILRRLNGFHFSNRERIAIFYSHPGEPARFPAVTSLPKGRGSSLTDRPILIDTPRLEFPLTRPISATSDSLIETKPAFPFAGANASRQGPPTSLSPYFPASRLRASVSPWPLIAAPRSLCDNVQFN
jgi:hypothetical protein